MLSILHAEVSQNIVNCFRVASVHQNILHNNRILVEFDRKIVANANHAIVSLK